MAGVENLMGHPCVCSPKTNIVSKLLLAGNRSLILLSFPLSWSPVEGTADICQCCNKGSCGIPGRSRRLVGQWHPSASRSRRQGRSWVATGLLLSLLSLETFFFLIPHLKLFTPGGCSFGFSYLKQNLLVQPTEAERSP